MQMKVPWINILATKNTIMSKIFWKGWNQRDYETEHELEEKVIIEIVENI